MSLYTFYPFKPDGTSETFVALDLVDDAAAQVYALHVLDEHPSAARVVSWCGERRVLMRDRAYGHLRAGLTQDRSPR